MIYIDLGRKYINTKITIIEMICTAKYNQILYIWTIPNNFHLGTTISYDYRETCWKTKFHFLNSSFTFSPSRSSFPKPSLAAGNTSSSCFLLSISPSRFWFHHHLRTQPPRAGWSHIGTELSRKGKQLFILQGLGVGPGSATERWPSTKIARKWPFFLGQKKITLKKYFFFAYIF